MQGTLNIRLREEAASRGCGVAGEDETPGKEVPGDEAPGEEVPGQELMKQWGLRSEGAVEESGVALRREIGKTLEGGHHPKAKVCEKGPATQEAVANTSPHETRNEPRRCPLLRCCPALLTPET